MPTVAWRMLLQTSPEQRLSREDVYSMLLNELFDYKSEIIRILCNNKDIVRLLMDEKEPVVLNYDLAYEQIFPYEYIPDTVDEATTFICFDVDITNLVDKIYYNPVLYVWAFTYKLKLRLDDGGIRIDRLAMEINKELSGNRNFGLGELELRSVTSFSPIKDYQGRQMVYTATDFNRPGVSKKPPANRKYHE